MPYDHCRDPPVGIKEKSLIFYRLFLIIPHKKIIIKTTIYFHVVPSFYTHRDGKQSAISEVQLFIAYLYISVIRDVF